MKPYSPITAGKSMLGAALAGLSLVATDAEAVVYSESADFGGDFSSDPNNPTDLGSTFGNFLSDSGILGSLTPDEVGVGDNIRLSVTPSTPALINFSASGDALNAYFNLFAYNSEGLILDEVFLQLPVIGQTYESSLSFTTPADGIIILGTGSEAGPGTVNYSIGAVPEPTSALLGAAGLAAAALRRSRKGV